MIGKVTRGTSTGGLLRYLYGPGRANEHTRPHLVASWLGDDRRSLAELEPGVVEGKFDTRALADRLDLPLQLRPGAVEQHVWQCSMRVSEGDRRLSDDEWAVVARDVVERTGFAPADDPGACRWVAVRHADDHVHIAVVLARQDGGRVTVFRDWPKVHAAARAAEHRFGLLAVGPPQRRVDVAPDRAEVEKALRQQGPEASPARTWLTKQVRIAAAASTSAVPFEAMLNRSGVLVRWRESTQRAGEVTGYSVGRPGDLDADGRQVWFGGSKLSPDLSLPRLQDRWTEDGRGRTSATPPTARDQVWRRAERALFRAADGPATAASGVSGAEAAVVMSELVGQGKDGRLANASATFADAVRLPRGRRPVTAHRVHGIRHVAADLASLGAALPGEAGDAALIFGHLARIAANLGHRRVADQLVQAVVSDVRIHVPRGWTPRRVVADVVPAAVAARVLDDPAWPLLRTELTREPERAAERLAAAASTRELESAVHPAAVLHHRLVRENHRSEPAAPSKTLRGATPTYGVSVPARRTSR